MSKSSSVLKRRLFDAPVPYDVAEPRKTIIVTLRHLDGGSSVVSHDCVEDFSNESVSLDFRESKLQNLVSKGVEPHSLDMIDTNKMGVDSGVDALANHIINNASSFVESSKSE